MRPRDAARRARKRPSVLWRFVQMASIIGVLTSLNATVSIISVSRSGFTSIESTVQAYAGGMLEYAVPEDADFSTLPASSTARCSREQQSWLEANGARVNTLLRIELSNRAEEGPVVSVSNLRVEGERLDSQSVHLLVRCFPDFRPNAFGALASLDTTLPRNVARYEPRGYAVRSTDIPQVPLTWNLEPGEVGQIVLQLQSSSTVHGTLMGSILHRGEVRRVGIGQGEGYVLHLPALLDGGQVWVETSDQVSCTGAAEANLVACEAALAGS